VRWWAEGGEVVDDGDGGDVYEGDSGVGGRRRGAAIWGLVGRWMWRRRGV